MSNSYRRNNKIVKYQKTHFNIGIVAFVFIFIYIMVYVMNFSTKEVLSMYEVNEKQMSDDNQVVGFAIREETVYNAQTGGAVAFYNNKSKKVLKESPIFSIDSSGVLSDYFVESEDDNNLNQSEIDNVRNVIHNYKINYNNADYNTVRDFKYSLESSMLSFMSEETLNKFIEEINKNGNGGAIQTAKESGIITYWTDGYENVDVQSITKKHFDTSNYRKTSLKSSDSVNVGNAVCKVVTNEEWSLVVNLTSEQYTKLEGSQSVKLRFVSDGLEMITDIELFTSGEDFFAELKFTKYLSRYLDERFINIELLFNSVEGLKIPVSSIFEKNCYKVPADFISKGGKESNDCLVYEAYDKEGKKSFEKVDSFCMKDDEFVYIDTSLIEPGTIFVKSDTNETYKAEEMQALKGVYNVNKGYCRFKFVDILYENPEYCIVDKHTAYGLSVYDNIILNPDLIGENDIIY